MRRVPSHGPSDDQPDYLQQRLRRDRSRDRVIPK